MRMLPITLKKPENPMNLSLWMTATTGKYIRLLKVSSGLLKTQN
jgi:hypothetical protein